MTVRWFFGSLLVSGTILGAPHLASARERKPYYSTYSPPTKPAVERAPFMSEQADRWVLQTVMGVHVAAFADAPGERAEADYFYGESGPSFSLAQRFMSPQFSIFRVGPELQAQYYVGLQDIERGNFGRGLVRTSAVLSVHFDRAYFLVPFGGVWNWIPNYGNAVEMSADIGVGFGTGVVLGIIGGGVDDTYASLELSFRFDEFVQKHTFRSATDSFSENATYTLMWFGVSGTLWILPD